MGMSLAPADPLSAASRAPDPVTQLAGLRHDDLRISTLPLARYGSRRAQNLDPRGRWASATPFVELMLGFIRTALETQPEHGSESEQDTEQVTEQAAEQVRRLVQGLGHDKLSARSLMERLGLRHRPTFVQDYLHPALAAGLVAMTDPDHPRSPRQAYRLTEAGLRRLEQFEWARSSREISRP